MGFTESVLPPADQHILPGLGVGITNLVGRVTAAASELSVSELREGGATDWTQRWRSCGPRCVAVLGLRRTGPPFADPEQQSAVNPKLLGGALLWLLPNPSGLQARYQIPEMEEMFRSLFVATAATCDGGVRRASPMEVCGIMGTWPRTA